MIGVAENDLRAERFDDVLRHGLDAACRSDRHKDRSFDGLMGQMHLHATSTGPRGIEQVECEAHFVILAGEYCGRNAAESRRETPCSVRRITQCGDKVFRAKDAARCEDLPAMNHAALPAS